MEEEYPLASKWDRLLAGSVDIALVWGPEAVVYLAFYQQMQNGGAQPSLLLLAAMGACCLAVLLVQMMFLIKSGQTIGKKWRDIRIIRRLDGENGGFMTNVMMRCILNQVLCFFPFYGIIDLLFIFSPQNRCMHDRLAGTLVIRNTVSPVEG